MGREVARQMTVGSKEALEQMFWRAVDKPHGNQEPSEYKHVVLGLMFPKWSSDRFDGGVAV